VDILILGRFINQKILRGQLAIIDKNAVQKPVVSTEISNQNIVAGVKPIWIRDG
jgi:hypothetical protein